MKRTLLSLVLLILFCSISYSYEALENPYYVYKARGDRMRHLGYYQEAIKEYEKATTLRKEAPECYYWVAYLLKGKGLYSQALIELNKAKKYSRFFKDEGENLEISYLEAEINFYQNNLDKTLEILKKLVTDYTAYMYQHKQDRPAFLRKFAKAHFILALYQISYSKVDDSDKFTIPNLLNECIELNFYSDHCYYFMYRIAQKIKDPNANTYLDRAKELNPNILIDIKNKNWKDLTTLFEMEW